MIPMAATPQAGRNGEMTVAVLFICWGNSCRSIMGEALARHLLPDSWTIASAGLQPLGFVTPETLQVLTEEGIATTGLRSKGLSEISGREISVVVNLTNSPLKPLLPGNFSGRVVCFPVPDPYGGSIEDYRQARDLIRRFITEELPRHLSHYPSSE
ncbi:MAG: arsenate-mycothiol transferase ArsC [Desulfobaccales bacterium]